MVFINGKLLLSLLSTVNNLTLNDTHWWHCSICLWSLFCKVAKMYIDIKKNKTNVNIYFLRKTRNETLIIYNGMLIIMYWSISK